MICTIFQRLNDLTISSWIAWSFSSAVLILNGQVFKLIASFKSERNFIVWDAISQALWLGGNEEILFAQRQRFTSLSCIASN